MDQVTGLLRELAEHEAAINILTDKATAQASREGAQSGEKVSECYTTLIMGLKRLEVALMELTQTHELLARERERADREQARADRSGQLLEVSEQLRLQGDNLSAAMSEFMAALGRKPAEEPPPGELVVTPWGGAYTGQGGAG